MIAVTPSLNVVEVSVSYNMQITNMSLTDCITTLRIAQLCRSNYLTKELATCLGLVISKELKQL